MDRYINAPIDNEIVNSLKAGDCVYITGTIYKNDKNYLHLIICVVVLYM